MSTARRSRSSPAASGRRSPAVDSYIAAFPADAQVALAAVRDAIHQAVPGADESIRYGMPCIGVDGAYVIHFAGWKRHIGLYPVPPLDVALERDIAGRRAAKDTLRIRLDEPVPFELVVQVISAVAERKRSER